MAGSLESNKPFLVSTEKIPGVMGYRTFASFKDSAQIEFALHKDRLAKAAGYDGETEATIKAITANNHTNAGTVMGVLVVNISGGKTETKNYYGGVEVRYQFSADAQIKISGVPACCTAVEAHNPAITLRRTAAGGFPNFVTAPDPGYIAFVRAFFDYVVAVSQRCGYSVINGHHHPESCYQHSGWPMIAQWVADRSQHHMALWATIIPPYDKDKDEAFKLGFTRDGVCYTPPAPKPITPVAAAPVAAVVAANVPQRRPRRCPEGRFANHEGLCGSVYCWTCNDTRRRLVPVMPQVAA